MRKPRNAKDILAKHLSSAFPQDALSFFGIPGIQVHQALPTELNQIEIRQDFTDMLFRLEDGTLLHIEYQSTSEPTLYRFLRYDAELTSIYQRKIRTLILYTEKDEFTHSYLDAGTIRYEVETIFLARYDGDSILATIEQHLKENTWTPSDRIALAFASRYHYQTASPAQVLDRMLHLTKQIPDPTEQNYVAALLLGLGVRNLGPEQEKRLKEVLFVNRVILEIEQEALKRGREQGWQEGKQEEAQAIAKKLLLLNIDINTIAETTGLSIVELETLRKSRP